MTTKITKVFNQSFVKLARSRALEIIDSGDRGSVPRPDLAAAIASETDADVVTVRGAIDACLAGGLLKGLTTRRGRKGGIVREVEEADVPVEAAPVASVAPVAPAAEPEESCADVIEAAAAEAEADDSPPQDCPEPSTDAPAPAAV